ASSSVKFNGSHQPMIRSGNFVSKCFSYSNSKSLTAWQNSSKFLNRISTTLTFYLDIFSKWFLPFSIVTTFLIFKSILKKFTPERILTIENCYFFFSHSIWIVGKQVVNFL